MKSVINMKQLSYAVLLVGVATTMGLSRDTASQWLRITHLTQLFSS